MNVKEAAEKFNKSEKTIVKWCEKNYIRGITIDKITKEYIIPNSAKEPYTRNRSKGDAIYTSMVKAVMGGYDICAALYKMDESEFNHYIQELINLNIISTFISQETGITYYCQSIHSSEFSKLKSNKVINFLKLLKPNISFGVSI